MTQRQALPVLIRQFKQIKVNGQSAIKAVEAYGSRVGSYYRLRGVTPESDLDLLLVVDETVGDARVLLQVRAEAMEIATMFTQTTGLRIGLSTEFDFLAPAFRASSKGSPFIRLDE
jgi:hypothetical protein